MRRLYHGRFLLHHGMQEVNRFILLLFFVVDLLWSFLFVCWVDSLSMLLLMLVFVVSHGGNRHAGRRGDNQCAVLVVLVVYVWCCNAKVHDLPGMTMMMRMTIVWTFESTT